MSECSFGVSLCSRKYTEICAVGARFPSKKPGEHKRSIGSLSIDLLELHTRASGTKKPVPLRPKWWRQAEKQWKQVTVLSSTQILFSVFIQFFLDLIESSFFSFLQLGYDTCIWSAHQLGLSHSTLAHDISTFFQNQLASNLTLPLVNLMNWSFTYTRVRCSPLYLTEHL